MNRYTASPQARWLVLIALLAALATWLLVPSPVAPAVRQAELEWEPCGSFECARLSVPLDYEALDGRQIEIALVRLLAGDTRNRIGSLLVNPGGPGGSGTEFVRIWAAFLPAAIHDRFDIVGFDPRGVGEGTALACRGDVQGLAALDPTPDSPSEWSEISEIHKAFAELCALNGGDLLPHFGSDNVARDMDRIRAALGDEKLTYVGYSYGTVIGALYAELFPDRVRALVLDGAVDTSLSSDELALQQAIGFEAALARFLDDCRERRCLPEALGDPLAAIEELLRRAEAEPIPAPAADRPAGEGETTLGLLVSLYSHRNWRLLERAIETGLAGDGNRLIQLTDFYLGRRPDGGYPNQTEMNTAVNCLDYSYVRDPAHYEALAVEFAAASPHFGAFIAQSGLACAHWPTTPKPLPTPRGVGAPPILVIGTTGDPATPYEWAVSLSEQLESAVLLTRHGEGHTAYRSGSACTDEIVDAYLIRLELPAAGASCDGPEIDGAPPDDALDGAKDTPPSGTESAGRVFLLGALTMAAVAAIAGGIFLLLRRL